MRSPTPPTPAAGYALWLAETARRLRTDDRPPRTPEEARRRAAALRRRIRAAEGDALAPEARAPLAPEILGVLSRDGYRVERLIFQTRPGCCATANFYLPTSGKGPFPGVLCVHGHWAGARRDPVVQSRCIGLAKLGFAALTLDAWGAGERGTHPGQNEYHGGLLGASLWPAGTPLHGLQLYDNIRALDYLQSRPEVDGSRLGCTGASGGGNQTTYISAYDERIRCAVPVCSVGTFESYLTTACCVDEVLLGALTFAEEGDLLGMVAPRALMVITASRDSYHFGPTAARAALERARHLFQVHGAKERLRHMVIESGHAYNQPMREAMYGWMRRWLKDQGDGSPVPEPPIHPEDPAAIACFDPAARPAKVMTTVRWVYERARGLSEAARLPATGTAWAEARRKKLSKLREVLSVTDKKTEAALNPLHPAGAPGPEPAELSLLSEPGVAVPVSSCRPGPGRSSGGTALLLHPLGRAAALQTPLAQNLRDAGIRVLALELRGCGELALPNQALGESIPDHNLVEWSLWIGRPLLGQWVHDIRQLIASAATTRAASRKVAIIGWREAGLAALLAAALDSRVRGVAAVETLASYVHEGPPHSQQMVVFTPDLLKVGDVPHLAALSAPRPVLLANLIRMDGTPIPPPELDSLSRWPRELYGRLDHAGRFTARAGLTDAEIAAAVKGWLT